MVGQRSFAIQPGGSSDGRVVAAGQPAGPGCLLFRMKSFRQYSPTRSGTFPGALIPGMQLPSAVGALLSAAERFSQLPALVALPWDHQQQPACPSTGISNENREKNIGAYGNPKLFSGKRLSTGVQEGNL